MRPLGLEVLALVDDQQVHRRPRRGRGLDDGGCEPVEDAGLRVVDRIAALAHQPGAELVEGVASLGHGCHASHRIGQRPVEADVQRRLAGHLRRAQLLEGELRLARACRADHPQAVRLQLEPARPGGQPAGQPAVLVAREATHRIDARQRIDQAGQKGVHVGSVRRFGAVGVSRGRRKGPSVKQLDDARGQPVAPARIDDAVRINRRRQRPGQLVIGQVGQVVDVETPAGKPPAELGHQTVQVAGDLHTQALERQRI